MLVSAASGGPEAKVAKGGTYRVGWESSFGWTDSFDPTGEYLANAFAIYTNLLLRDLVGYNHVGGAAGNDRRPGPRDVGAEADERWQDVHVQAQERRQVRSAGEPRDHVAGRQVRGRAARATRRTAAQYGFYYTVIKGWDAYGKGKTKSHLGHQDAEREDDRLQPHDADR